VAGKCEELEQEAEAESNDHKGRPKKKKCATREYRKLRKRRELKWSSELIYIYVASRLGAATFLPDSTRRTIRDTNGDS
jgi:hypothetical protein